MNKERFKNKLKENEIEYQTELREKYNPDNLFKDKVKASARETTMSMVDYKESIFTKLKN